MSEVVLSREDQYNLQVIEDLNKPRGEGIAFGLKYRLHDDQIEVLKSIYERGMKNIFLACGRKYGKTELAAYVLWHQALTVPGSCCFYITPEAVGGRKIIWEGQRLQKFLGEDSAKYIAGPPRNQDMTLRFKNGSYIQIVGSDNYMVANGLTPDIAVYDEFKGFNYRWHQEFAPNRVAKDATLVFIGTKPRAGNKNMDQYNEILKYAKATPKKWYVAERTTFDNPLNHRPHIKEAIDEEIRQLRARGEEDVVQLEYYSRYMPGGKRAVFPMFDRSKHIYDHDTLMEEVNKSAKRGEWAWIADPANTSTFGNLFGMLNRYTGDLYILDEIYEQNQKETSVGRIVPKGLKMCKELNPWSSIKDDWMLRADDQATWFMTEALAQCDVNFYSAEKWRGDKEEGLSLIKDQMLKGKLKISSRCANLADELEAYAKDQNGKIPKKNDHLIDCLRYFNIGVFYDFSTIQAEVDDRPEIEQGRYRNHVEENDAEDWTDMDYDEFDLG